MAQARASLSRPQRQTILRSDGLHKEGDRTAHQVSLHRWVSIYSAYQGLSKTHAFGVLIWLNIGHKDKAAPNKESPDTPGKHHQINKEQSSGVGPRSPGP